MARGVQNETVMPLARRRLPGGPESGEPSGGVSILNALPDSVLMVGSYGAIQFANFAAENFFGDVSFDALGTGVPAGNTPVTVQHVDRIVGNRRDQPADVHGAHLQHRDR